MVKTHKSLKAEYARSRDAGRIGDWWALLSFGTRYGISRFMRNSRSTSVAKNL